MNLEVENNSLLNVDIEPKYNIEVNTGANVELEKSDYIVHAQRKEYKVVGDNIYIPKLYDDAPQWMKDLIGNVVDVKTSIATGNLDDALEALRTLATELEVAKNTYTMSIVSSNDIDLRITTAIESLNSSLSDADATILNIAQTAVTPEEASAIAISVLSASLGENGAIGSFITNMNAAFVDLNSATTQSINFMESAIAAEFEGTASALESLRTHVGVSEDGGITGTGLLSTVQVLQKQNDGVIEVTTGTYDVMTGIENPNININNDGLVTTALPYANWLPLILTVDPTGEDLQYRVCQNTLTNKYFMYYGNSWKEITQYEYNEKEDMLRSIHVGDVYIMYSSSTEGYKTYVRAYKFIKTSVDETSPYATDAKGYTWSVIVDTDAQNAYVAALNAYDLADSKRRVFTSTPTAPYDEGDLWIDSSGTYSVIKSYDGSLWTIADEQLEGFINETYEPKISTLENQTDGTIEYYYYNGTGASNEASTLASKLATWNTQELKENHTGDVVYFKDTKHGYWYSNKTNSWNSIVDTSILQALKVAEDAQSAADGVVVSFYAVEQSASAGIDTTKFKYWYYGGTLKYYNGSSWDIKSGLHIGDTLTTYVTATKDTKVYIYNGTSWYTQTENGIVAQSEAITNLNASLEGLDTTVNGSSSVENSINARISAKGTEIESKWAYNSQVNLNGTTYSSGFGLATSLTAGSGLTTGQSEFWIKADKFKLMSADGTKKSSYSPFTVVASTGEITFNGKVSFSNTTGVPASNSNLLYNSEPKVGYETEGWELGYNTTGKTVVRGAGYTIWRPTGSGSVYMAISGAVSGGMFDIGQYSKKVSVVAGSSYEVSAYLSAHRCTAYIAISFYNTSDEYIGEYHGNSINNDAGSGALANWSRSTVIATAPSNAATALVFIRGYGNGGSDPVVFASHMFLGKCFTGQTTVSDWSEGTSIGALGLVDVTGPINNNNDLFAQKLGYVNYAAIVAAASSGQTIINGGYIRTSLIDANSITANQINTTGLIAENISANEIIGKIITGGVINGARINGAVIKASYLDLDGDLEVLTNYIITVAMYNSNPSLYTDAVYISADNQYRIPSLSTVREAVKNVSITTPSTNNGVIYSYNTANIGSNLKAVKISPTFNNTSSFEIIKATAYNDHQGTINYILSNKFRLKLGSIILMECVMEWESAAGQWDGNLMYAKATFSGAYFSTVQHLNNAYYGYYNSSANYSFNIGIGTLSVTVQCNREIGYYAPITVTCSLEAGSMLFPGAWTSGALNIEALNLWSSSGPDINPHIHTSNINFKLNSSLNINNMI